MGITEDTASAPKDKNSTKLSENRIRKTMRMMVELSTLEAKTTKQKTKDPLGVTALIAIWNQLLIVDPPESANNI